MASILRLTPPVASSSVDLENDANVSGSGAPAHTPRRATQTYIDTETGTVYEWWNGTWHP